MARETHREASERILNGARRSLERIDTDQLEDIELSICNEDGVAKVEIQIAYRPDARG